MFKKISETFLDSRRRKILSLLFLGTLFLVVLFFALPNIVARSVNRVHGPGPYPVTPNAKEMHKDLVIIDLHADSLLWDRDLLIRSQYGHVDLPRMIEGNLALQAFTIVTKVPMKRAFSGNEIPADVTIKALVMAQRWPRATWTSLHARALYQARRLHDLEKRSKGQFRVIKSQEELTKYLKERKENPKLAAGFLGIEGGHCLEGKLENLDELFNAGVRMFAPTHFFDSELGGSAHGNTLSGLTEFGRAVIKRMEALGMVVDVAHASPQLIDDILAMATKPIFVSHTGVKGTHDSPRNLSDKHIKEIAKGGGVVGIAFFKSATGGVDMDSVVKAMDHCRNIGGIDCVALGSDFDGSVAMPFDSSQMDQLTSALLEKGWSQSDIKKTMGENVLRVLEKTFPKN
ncbi:MAG: dipeptidase [Planctomycetota bacterium]|nr:dipeptidase [Planctomycetota bacterium]